MRDWGSSCPGEIDTVENDIHNWQGNCCDVIQPCLCQPQPAVCNAFFLLVVSAEQWTNPNDGIDSSFFINFIQNDMPNNNGENVDDVPQKPYVNALEV